ncbi:MAG: class I SAM-dependent methyltransferase [Pyrinomonadaceae bacterium]
MKIENADTVERFSNRVENYAMYRPGYPAAIMEFFTDKLGLTSDSVLADIGSGTGLSSKPFLEIGAIVYGVEPNAAMRAAAEKCLSEFDNFRSTDGTASDTTLENNSIDFVIAAQAFHWFEPEPTRSELKRILKQGGYVCLIWNERQLNTTEFLIEYENLLLKYANDYEKVRHENIDESKLSSFFETEFERQTFANEQVLDFAGLKGRLLSSSYMPAEKDEKYEPMAKELHALFAKHEQGGKITILYDTNVFYTQF